MKIYLLTRPNKVVSTFLVLIFLSVFQGCMYYYKVQTVNKVTPQEIKKYDSLNKYLILHQRHSAWHLSNPGITDNILSGDLTSLPGDHLKYRTTDPNRGNRYKKNKELNESGVLNEVHLYLKDTLVPTFAKGDKIQIAFSTFSKAEAYMKAKGRTTASWLVPAIGGTVVGAGAAVGIAAIIVALFKSSCPLIYIKKDTNFAFAGEIFGGAIYSSLERHDYLPLPGFQPSNNCYTLKITNGLPEIQYVNLAELWIVNHPENVTVLPDRHGIVHSISKPEPPVKAVSSAKSNLLSLVNNKDQRSFLFDEEPAQTGDTCAFNTVFLTFSVPDQADTGKLIISAGNSMWGDYTYGEFMKLFGDKYDKWVRTQAKKPAEKSIQWKMEQRFVLMAYLETNNGWQFIDYFDMIGPLGARELVMPVDLSHAMFATSPENEKTIRIKLESGFKFWELDYAGMDFSRDTLVKINYIQPSSATTESGKDVTQLLKQNDTEYYVQEKTGEEGSLVFQDSPEIIGMKKSVFLHTKGYYQPVRNFPGSPDKKRLLTFQIPGKFSKFSFDNYTEFRKNKCVLISEPNVP